MEKRTFQPGDRLLTCKELLKLIPYSRQHLYRLMAAGKFPQPIKLGERRIAWVERDVLNWLSERM